MTFWQALCVSTLVLGIIILFCYAFVGITRFLEEFIGETPALVIVSIVSMTLVLWMSFG